MNTYNFTLIIRDKDEFSDGEADALFAAGCDDALPGSSHGVATIDFARAGDDLAGAIASAIRDVAKLGYKVAKIEET